MVVWLFLGVPWVCLRFVIVVFPDHAHLRLKYLALMFLVLKLSYAIFILLINVKMPTIVGILTFMGRINFMLS